MSVLTQAKVHELVASKNVLFDVSASTPIVEVFNLLEQKNILSVPVFGQPGSWLGAGGDNIVIGGKQYIGIVSVLDLVACVFRNSSTTSFGINEKALVTTELMKVLGWPVSSAIGSTDESLSLWIEQDDKAVMDAMEQFAKGVHRALVLPISGLANEVKLLTQTDVVTFLSEKRFQSASLERIFNSKLKDLHQPDQTKDIVNVSMSDNLIDALNVLLESKVHGVGVVDDEGKLKSVLSVSDLRGMMAPRLASLRFLTVSDFLQQKEPRRFDEVVPVPFICNHDDRLGIIVEAILQLHFHRVWLIDNKNQPTDVLTLTDIINIVWGNERAAMHSLE
jgi:predicted transcriptional regulator